jgi:hypothetical protein
MLDIPGDELTWLIAAVFAVILGAAIGIVSHYLHRRD